MEESVKRRERLKAMRTEASEPGVCNDFLGSTPAHNLANPLIETQPAVPVESCATPRFDYYTDPMSAFSGNKSRSKVSNHILPEHCTPTRPVYQARANYSPDQSMYQSQGPPSYPQFRSPDQSMFQSHGPYPHFRSPDQNMYPSQGPYPHFRSPMRMSNPSGNHQQTPPGVWNASGGTSNYCHQSNSPRADNFPGDGFEGGGGSPNLMNSTRGRGQWFSNNNTSPGLSCGGSPSPSGAVRGRGRWSSNNTSFASSGRGGRRGRGSHENISAEFRPDVYYNKSMVEDPWKYLVPVACKKESVAKNTPGSVNSWLPESIRQKKPKVSDAPNASSSQPSLAEYLAASFNEAASNKSVNEASNNESVNEAANNEPIID